MEDKIIDFSITVQFGNTEKTVWEVLSCQMKPRNRK